MITGLVFFIIAALGALLVYKNREYHGNDFFEFIGLVLSVVFSIVLIIHILSIVSIEYDYNIWLAKRNAFEETLSAARQSGNKYEVAAIVSEISKWNEELSVAKFKKDHWYFSQYYDDRVKTLEPIK
jgi:sensor domain CHASE-containing protein